MHQHCRRFAPISLTQLQHNLGEHQVNQIDQYRSFLQIQLSLALCLSFLGRDLSQTKPSPIRLHPKLPAIYRAKVEKLTEALTDPAIRDEAAEAIRGLIDAVAVEMTEVGPEVEVRGEISKMIGFSDPKIEQNQCSVKVVAGLGFEPRTFRL